MISLLKSIFSTTETRVLVVAAERATLYLFRDGEIAQAYILTPTRPDSDSSIVV